MNARRRMTNDYAREFSKMMNPTIDGERARRELDAARPKKCNLQFFVLWRKGHLYLWSHSKTHNSGESERATSERALSAHGLYSWLFTNESQLTCAIRCRGEREERERASENLSLRI